MLLLPNSRSCLQTLLCVLFLVTAFVFPRSGNAAAEKVILAANFELGVFRNSISYVECALEKMLRAYRLVDVPWKRAQLGTRDGDFDGFFGAVRNDVRDAYAVYSDPMYFFNWLYVVRKDSEIAPNESSFKDRTFLANVGSARYTWLQEKYKNKEITKKIIDVLDSQKSMKMLNAGRVDVLLENEHNLKKVFRELALDPTDFKTFVAKTQPVGLYLGKHFMKREPDFLGKFNIALKQCK